MKKILPLFLSALIVSSNICALPQAIEWHEIDAAAQRLEQSFFRARSSRTGAKLAVPLLVCAGIYWYTQSASTNTSIGRAVVGGTSNEQRAGRLLEKLMEKVEQETAQTGEFFLVSWVRSCAGTMKAGLQEAARLVIGHGILALLSAGTYKAISWLNEYNENVNDFVASTQLIQVLESLVHHADALEQGDHVEYHRDQMSALNDLLRAQMVDVLGYMHLRSRHLTHSSPALFQTIQLHISYMLNATNNAVATIGTHVLAHQPIGHAAHQFKQEVEQDLAQFSLYEQVFN